jgi:hypothetical protein
MPKQLLPRLAEWFLMRQQLLEVYFLQHRCNLVFETNQSELLWLILSLAGTITIAPAPESVLTVSMPMPVFPPVTL